MPFGSEGLAQATYGMVVKVRVVLVVVTVVVVEVVVVEVVVVVVGGYVPV
jgi:hypothetical protein